MYTNYPNQNLYQYKSDINKNNVTYLEDERFLWAPFIFGGLAGTALGYGIANNNQLNNHNGYYYPMYPIYPTYTYPVYPTYQNTNYYY